MQELKWQLISTAPRDCDEVEIINMDHGDTAKPYKAFRLNNETEEHLEGWWCNDKTELMYPTHWRPLLCYLKS